MSKKKKTWSIYVICGMAGTLTLFQNFLPTKVAPTSPCLTYDQLKLKGEYTETPDEYPYHTTGGSERSYKYVKRLIKLTQSGDYILCKDQTIRGVRIQIASSDINFDCNGSEISGAEHQVPDATNKSLGMIRDKVKTEGIYVAGVSSVENVNIKNCNFNNINSAAIQVHNANEEEIIPVQFEGSSILYNNNIYPIRHHLDEQTKKEHHYILAPYKMKIKYKDNATLAVKRPYLLNYDNTTLTDPDPKFLSKVLSRMRKLSTRNIVIDNISITNGHGTGLNLGGGVTGVTLKNSKFTNINMPIYLSPNSFANIITKNTFIQNTHRRTREFIAIDGSYKNLINGNIFQSTNSSTNKPGGIYLYKNCWEYFEGGLGGYPRLAGSDENHIRGNVFEGLSTAVWVASRQAEDQEDRSCGDISPYTGTHFIPGDSKRYFLDYARNNRIRHNTFVNNQLAINVEDNNTLIEENNFSSNNVAPYVKVGTSFRSYLGKGTSVKGTRLLNNRLFKREARFEDFVGIKYMGTELYLNGNNVKTSLGWHPLFEGQNPLKLSVHERKRQISGNNDGIRDVFECPNQGVVMNAKATCNLETENFDTPAVRKFRQDQSWGSLKVILEADGRNGGNCILGNFEIDHGVTETSWDNTNVQSITYGCKDFDRNGGDCVIAASFICKSNQ